MSSKRNDFGPRMSQTVTHNGAIYLTCKVGDSATTKEQISDNFNEIDRETSPARAYCEAKQAVPDFLVEANVSAAVS